MNRILQSKILLLFMVIITMSAHSQGVIPTPRTPSPAAEVRQTIGISTVTVNYSRPKVNGREVFGKLVPYGWNQQGFGNNKPAPWRAGANENTTIEFSHDATVEGIAVPKGIYGLFFVINADNSGEVILSKDYRSWGSFFYEASRDQLKAKIQVRDVPHTELLTYDFINLDKNGGELVLRWEKKEFPVKIRFAVDEIVMANAEEELKSTVGFTPQGVISAANYAAANNVNHEKALAWIDGIIANNKTFPVLRVKSTLLEQTGRNDEAKKLMAEAMTVATENEINNYGYQLLGQGKHDEAIKILVVNTERFPKSANAWDSLGEAYATKGDKDNAIKTFKKSLSLNPPPNVKANSEKYLRQLGAL